MSTIPKHERAPRKVKKQSQSHPTIAESHVVVTGGMDPSAPFFERAIQHDINHVEGLGNVAEKLDWIGDAIARLSHDDTNVGVAVCQNQYGGPVKLTLAENDNDDTMGRFVTALERIADSVAKLAGLTRPRLESWHEQDEYEPRYKAVACDGGAPGPKIADAVTAGKAEAAK